MQCKNRYSITCHLAEATHWCAEVRKNTPGATKEAVWNEMRSTNEFFSFWGGKREERELPKKVPPTHFSIIYWHPYTQKIEHCEPSLSPPALAPNIIFIRIADGGANHTWFKNWTVFLRGWMSCRIVKNLNWEKWKYESTWMYQFCISSFSSTVLIVLLNQVPL